DIDEEEVMEAPLRLESIADYIIQNHDRKTHHRDFTAIFCVSSVETLIKYYEIFKKKKEEGKHDLKIATVYSYEANEESRRNSYAIATSSHMAAEDAAVYATCDEEIVYKHSREKLDEFIADYNKSYGTNFSTREGIYKYKDDISRRVKDGKIDVLLVVNMFLTGFDSKTLNTLYVDKNLKYHGLIQAFSRTNRILNARKSQGEIVCFRNLKEATDESILLFSNNEADASKEILMKPYEVYQAEMKEAVEKLKDLVPEVDSVDELVDENQEAEFVKAFREIMKLKNILESFSHHESDKIEIEAQEFEDYKSKYLDLYDRVKRQTEKEKVSILNEIDFQLELIQKDEINVAYILRLLATIRSVPKAEEQKRREDIQRIIAGEVNLRSKKELIDKFIEKHLPHIEDLNLIHEAFEAFVEEERVAYIQDFAKEESLKEDGVKELIARYQFNNKEPQAKEIQKISKVKIGLKDRKSITVRVADKIKKYIEVLVMGV
ncbi:MAG: type I restriction endonuclease subunit R, partial [Bacteroidales bacterium]